MDALKEQNEKLKQKILTTVQNKFPKEKIYFLPSVSRTNELLCGREALDKACLFEQVAMDLDKDERKQIHLSENRIYVSLRRRELDGGCAPFLPEKVFQESLDRARQFNENLSLSSVAEINEFLRKEGEVSLVEVCENRLREQLVLGVKKILERKVRIIAISGPSSSAKTTTANKLRLGLLGKGLRPLRISLDDYYWLPKDAPRNKDGTRDVESVDSLDKEELQKELASLIRGIPTKLRTYHFKDKTADFKREETLSFDQPIILEGIHALNPSLLERLDSDLIYRIYVSPLPQVSLDPLNYFSLSDIRLLRRLVRDERTRNASYEETLRMWDSVREEEFKSIYKSQENADFVFDSFFPYEIGVLKKVSLKKLESIQEDSPYFSKAQELIKDLTPFRSVSLGIIPIDSSFREFIGKGVFKG